MEGTSSEVPTILDKAEEKYEGEGNKGMDKHHNILPNANLHKHICKAKSHSQQESNKS